MKEKKKSRFSGAVSSNAKKQKDRSNFGYINFPDGVSAFKEEPGKVMFFDILPYEVTDKHHPDKAAIEQADGIWYRRPFKVHSIPNGEFSDKVVCPSTFGKPCPICEYIKTLKNNGAEKEEWDAFSAKERNLYVVIPYGHKEMDEKPYIWDISQFIFQKALNDECAEDSDNEIFPDLENGLMLKIRFTKETFAGHEYAKIGRIDFVDREENGGKQYTEKILKKIPNLDEVLIVLSYKELEMKLTGIDENDLDETPANKDATKAFDKKKKPAKDADEDYEPIRKRKTAVADEDEDEQPKKKAKTPKKPAIPTWDELDDMDFDELVEVAEANEIDTDAWDEDELDDIKSYLVDFFDIESPKKKATKGKVSPEPEKKGKKKPIEEDEDDDIPFKERAGEPEIRIGTMVQHPKYGECEIVALNKKEMTATLADEDEERHVGIPLHKFNIISFGKEGEPGKITKKETEERRKPAKEDEKPTGKKKCPNGHVFGKDFEKFKDCSDCPLWDDCSDE
jgi:hypothetical protein